MKLPHGPVQLAFDLEHAFVNTIPSQFATQQKALALLQSQHPGRPIILLNEGFYKATYALMSGAPGIRPAATICLGIIPVILSSIDCPPAGLGLPPDSSPEGRARNKAMLEGSKELFARPQARFAEVFKELGATRAPPPLMDAQYLLPDLYLQMCLPAVEWPRSDAPKHLKFTGGLPKVKRGVFTNPPSWWNEIVDNKTKKIVLVCQGSVVMDHTELIIPTMNALAKRDDILVVVALGRKGVTLPKGTVVPSNSRIADYVPFDEVLPHCSIFITNGGYGAFQHGLRNGTPLIIGGSTEDKPEVAARAAWAGVAVNLKTATPEESAIEEAVDEILGNERYKKRAMELEAEMASYDPMGIVSQAIDELAVGTYVV